MTPPVGSRVTTRLVLATLPIFWRRNCTVTVSQGSMAPLGGEKLSEVKVAPAETILMTGVETCPRTVAVLFAWLGSETGETTLAVEARLPILVVVTTIAIVAQPPWRKIGR